MGLLDVFKKKQVIKNDAAQDNLAQTHRITPQFIPINQLIRSISNNQSFTVSQLLSSYEKVSSVAFCVDFIADKISSLPFIIRNKKSLVDVSEQFPVFFKENSGLSPIEYRKIIIKQMMLTGHSITETVGDVDIMFKRQFKVKDLILLRPLDIQYKTNEYGRIYAYNEQSQGRTFTDYNILHFYRPSPTDHNLGVPAIASCMRAIIGIELIENYSGNFYENGGQLGLAFITDKKLDDLSFKNQQERLRQQYGDQKQMIGLFDNSLMPMTLSMPTANDGMIDTQKAIYKTEIYEALKIPKVLGEGSDTSFANYNTALKSVYQDTLMPIALSFCDGFNKILPSDVECFIDFSGVDTLRESRIDDNKYLLEVLNANVIDQKEFRELVAESTGINPKIIYKPEVLEKKQDLQIETKEAKSDGELSLKEQIKLAEALRLEAELKHLNELLTLLNINFEKIVSVIYAGEITEAQYATQLARSLKIDLSMQIREIQRFAIKNGIKLSNEVFNKVSDVKVGDMSGTVFSAREKYISEITGNYSKDVYKLIRDGVNNGNSLEEIKKAITGKNGFNEAKAKLWAETEVSYAFNYSSLETAIDNGAKYKQWITMNDKNVRDSHQSLNRKIVGIKEAFSADDGQFPQQYHERCVLAFLKDLPSKVA